MINNETLQKFTQGKKVDLRTVISTTEDKVTLLQWLKAVEKALGAGTLRNVEVSQPTPEQAIFNFVFDDGTSVQSLPVTLPKGPKGDKGDKGEPGGGGGGTIDAADLIKLLEGSETIIVDLTQDGQRVEIHLDEVFKQTLATKTMLASKLNVDTVYSNDEPAFSDAMEQVTDLNSFYNYFYGLRKEPSKTYLIEGQSPGTFDNVKNALQIPVSNSKWALLCECNSSEAGGFFIKLSLVNPYAAILQTNIIGGWLENKCSIGKWTNALQPIKAATEEELGGIKANPKTEADVQPVNIDPITHQLFTAKGGGGGGGLVWKKITADELAQKATDIPSNQFKTILAKFKTNTIGLYSGTPYLYGTLRRNYVEFYGVSGQLGDYQICNSLVYFRIDTKTISYIKVIIQGGSVPKTTTDRQFDIANTCMEEIYILE